MTKTAKLALTCGIVPLLVAAGCTQGTTGFARADRERDETTIYFPDGQQAESVLALEHSLPEEVRVGQTFEYQLRVTNTTDDLVLRNVMVWDYVDADLDLLEANPQWQEFQEVERSAILPGREQRAYRTVGYEDEEGLRRGEQVYSTPQAAWLIRQLNPEESVTIRVRARARQEGRIVNCASAAYDMASCVTTNVVAPELSLNLDIQREFVICATDQLDLKAVVRNSGTGDVGNVSVRIELPQGLTFVEHGRAWTEAIGTLPAGETKSLSATIRAIRPGDYVIRATAAGAGGIATEAIGTQFAVRQGALQIEALGPQQDYVGLPVEYEIRVTNVGDARARDVEIENIVPAGMEFIDATDGGSLQNDRVVWTFDRLGPGESRTVMLRLRGEDREGTIRNVAVARAVCTGDVSTTIRTVLEGVPALLVEVVDELDPNQVGEEEVYQIRVKNQGSEAETNIIVRAELEEQMEFLAARGPTDTGAQRGAREIMFAPLQSLAPGQTAEWHVRVLCTGTGDIRFYAEVDSDQHGRPVRETEATRIYE